MLRLAIIKWWIELGICRSWKNQKKSRYNRSFQISF